jgi:predicted nucleic acid-binding protein
LTSYVLDASVAAKWFLAADEPLSTEALQLLRAYTSGATAFLVPDLFFSEFANVLWKAEQRGRCNALTADAALKEIIQRNIPTFPAAGLIQPALQLARAYRRAVYDCVYVALAVQTNTRLVTADERLVNSLAGQLPVTWLGMVS